MTRKQLIDYIKDEYGVTEDYPWEKDQTNAVFRHQSNRKWFALLMNIPASKLNIKSDKHIDVLNVKCDALMIGSITLEQGFYPAYHMNKSNWISIALEEADDEKTKWLIDMSFDATNVKIKANGG